jgi:hypothetical protein
MIQQFRGRGQETGEKTSSASTWLDTCWRPHIACDLSTIVLESHGTHTLVMILPEPNQSPRHSKRTWTISSAGERALCAVGVRPWVWIDDSAGEPSTVSFQGRALRCLRRTTPDCAG